MSLALYRRYRPETFAEVIGQEHVTGPLQQALRNNRVNHAYLFSGPRGCGKTTSARILARCLNCAEGPTPAPCGECQSCRDLARNGPGSIDVIEIDAASHGGVDDARDLREKAFFGPASSRYKIYIIDEAHMVTPQGFNALLKVVEEPPEHLKFIFATTEPEKVIGTIRSRTHHYPFRLVPPGTLRDYLGEVCGREQIPVEDGVLPLVVRAGAGSVRDSMSVMDQLLAGAAEQGVTYAMATALLGYTDAALLDEVVDAIAAHDGAAVFEIVDRVIEGGHDPRRFVADLLERLRDLVILAAVPDADEKGLIDAPADVVERMQAQAGVLGAAELSRAADLVNTGLTEMRGATSPRLQLELICARVLLPGAYEDERSLQARLDKLERRASLGGGMAGLGTGPATAPGTGTPVTVAPPGAPGGGAPPTGPAPGPVPGPEPAAPAAPAQPAASVPGSPPGSAPGQRPGAWPVPRSFQPSSGEQEPQATQPPHSSQQPQAAQQIQQSQQPYQPTSSQAPQTPPYPAAAQPPGAPAPSAPSVAAAEGAASVRQMWPQVLDAVKNRRRFTWILLSQNAQVAGFDGNTLQVSFPNAGARDSFVNGGSDEVLRQAVADALGVQWRIEAIVDPSGGTGGGQGGGPGSGPGSGFGAPSGPGGPGNFGGQAGPAPSSPLRSAASAAPAAVPPAASGPLAQGPAQAGSAAIPPNRSAGPPPSSAPRPEPPVPSPPPVAPEDDIPEEDDPDLDDTALTGHDLIVRELGATVIEEISND